MWRRALLCTRFRGVTRGTLGGFLSVWYRDLFKVGLMTSISEKLRGTLGSRITVAKSAQDFRFSPAFDKEALDIVDEALVRSDHRIAWWFVSGV